MTKPTCLVQGCASTRVAVRIVFRLPGYPEPGEGFVCPEHDHLVSESNPSYSAGYSVGQS